MRPRFEEMSYETTVMLEKAKLMNDRLDRIQEKIQKEELEMVEHEGKKVPHFAADGKGEKDEKKKGEGKDCPSCGAKVNKAGMCKAGCVPGHKMAKAQPGFAPEKITDINPHFVAESGGQTKSGYFTTNGRTIITEDGKPKRKKLDSKIDMARLSSRQNPHSDTGVVREEKFD